VLPRADQLPELHVMMDVAAPPEDPEEAAERRLANLRAWKRAIMAREGQMAVPPEAPVTETEPLGNPDA